MPEIKFPKFDPQWAQAKAVCRLNMEDIRMAKALGLSPKTLMRNKPSPAQRWKLPVKHWILELYEKKFGPKSAEVKLPREKAPDEGEWDPEQALECKDEDPF